ncbi:phage N-6-adenine-methyltransferase [Enterococcus dispar]|uniref:Phage N-6-adenine-methyltransferase n=1 Tax=Enterococcus dispar ATCC 51266 TaxID=1139219 RepID=S0KGH5_9ENTE|nr:phage N-6-adenine-methyltransferase [Enterococcus dispar]EOT38241.1 phage N-6-adenine-methyltransferase [Enterococcus dispar ATCC 51266]EOW86072.1 phage N-6-adenine-methyltransferase [Enterococcus dispar ATCC 51266]
MSLSYKAIMTSDNQDWETPQELFDNLNNEFDFELDAFASDKNAKCKHFFTERDDAFQQDWTKYKSIFINPPYTSKVQDEVLKKINDTISSNWMGVIVLLIPARTDTKRWHDYIFNKADDIRFIKGRLRFEVDGIPRGSSTFPSAVIVYDLRNKEEVAE